MKNKKIKNNFLSSISRVIKLLFKEHPFAVIISLLFAVCSTIFSIMGPKILGEATTKLFEGIVKKVTNTGSIDFNGINKILLIVLIIYVTSAIFSFIQAYVMANAATKTTYKLRNTITHKLNRLPVRYFETRNVGDILSIITNDIETLASNLNNTIIQIVTSVMTIIGILIMMLSINVTMTLVVLILVPIMFFIFGTIIGISQKYFTVQQKTLAKVNSEVEESFSGLNVITAFNHQEKSIETFNKENEKLYRASWKAQFLSGIMFPIINFIGNLGYVMVAIVGGILSINGKISVGNIQSFIQYVRNFTNPIGQIAQIINQLQSMSAASERIFEFLDAEEEILVEKEEKMDNSLGLVEFNNISFSYDGKKIVIEDFSSKVSKNKTVAIVGPTGAGKTTIVKLLMRFYDVDNGEIKVNGTNIKNIKRKNLRDNFTMVLQDTWLFKGSVMENIRYAKLSATDEEVKEAAKKAHANHFIESLPNSYDFEINEEASNLSNGEKQLITIARAILADKPILILDEATSSIDTRTEVLVQKAMNKLMENRTTFVIAHRLSTIRNADTILVLKEGNIIEQGNHEELLKKEGFYYDLYNSQFQEV
jgi:lipid A export ATP-binding/permease protein msbA